MANIVENAHVEVIAGRNKGDIGYISDASKKIVQVTTGDGNIFGVRRTSLRVLALPAASPNGGRMRTPNNLRRYCANCRGFHNNPGNQGDKKLSYPRVVRFLERMGAMVENNEITLTQWREIHWMVRHSCRVQNNA